MTKFVLAALCMLATCVVDAHDKQRPEDSILGAPAPFDSDKPGSIMLHGGGQITDDTFDRFIELAGGTNARIVFIPCAGYRVDDYDSEEEFLERLNFRYSAWAHLAEYGRVASFQFLFTDDPDDSEIEDFVRPLEEATGVWFSGGSQLRLNYRFVGHHPEQTLFQKKLHEVVARGGIVGGTSAGTAAIPEIMTMWSEKEHDDAPEIAVAAHGLGLLPGAIVEQHFETRAGRMERFTGLFRDVDRLDRLSGRRGAGKRMVGFAIEEESALIIQNNQLEVVGNGKSHVYLKVNGGKTIVWHELNPGDTGALSQSERNILGFTMDEPKLTLNEKTDDSKTDDSDE